MSKRTWTVRACLGALTGALVIAWSPAADAQSTRCEIPRAARDIWRCENGFVIGPENVIIRLPVPETDPEALYNAGIEAAGREDWRVAIAYFTAAHQRAHLVPRYMYNLGLAHARAGNEAAAIAWLSTYLVAEPNAPNRVAIWAQVTELEATAARKIDLLNERAESAAPLIPNVATSQYDQVGARSTALMSLASGAAQSDDWVRARRLLEASNALSLTQPPPASRLEELRSLARGVALMDNDLARAESLSREIQSTYLDSTTQAMFATLRDGGLNINLCQSYLLEAFLTRYICARTWAWGDPNTVALWDVLRTGDRARVLAHLQQRDNWRENPAALVLTGRHQDAYNLLVRADSAGFSGNNGEVSAAFVAEVLLRVGDASRAERFSQLADRSVRRRSAANGGTEYVYSGWFAARARALLMAERGEIHQANEFLQTYHSQRLGNWSFLMETYTPDSLWPHVRHDGTLVIIEYLIDRGRVEEALRLTSELDSLRRSLLLDQLSVEMAEGRIQAAHRPALNAAVAGLQGEAGYTNIDPVHRRALEGAIMMARTLPGACYDVDWWLAHQAQGATRPEGSPYDSQLLVGDLGRAASDIARGLRRSRVAYSRAGGVWGQ
ncbi:MAG: hypothetical protein NW206_10590 [Hyphomonadaceae bacterium]|nr:hypothetical protein [Hyphomonadaceae bacterium]